MATSLIHLNHYNFGNKNTVNGIKNNFFFHLPFLLIFGFYSHSGIADFSPKKDFNYINDIRKQTQLTPFTWNNELAEAAQNHANYLTANKTHGHREYYSRPLFTGEWVPDRALNAQYPHRMVSENVTSKSGDNKFYNPVDSLMSAIYHRFGFLDFTKNEIGIGHKYGGINSYVYVMGDTAFTDICKLPEFTDQGEYNYKICPNETKRIKKSIVDDSKQNTLLNNGKIVLWPTPDAINIPPVFFEESPDPLPHHSVSGYPISIQFNPAYFKSAPKITGFKLFINSTKDAIKTIKILDKNTDPNDVLSEFQHALFPLQRLDWNTTYNALVEYTDIDSNKKQSITWSFSTKHFEKPIITVNQSKQSIKVKKGQNYVLYFPPKHANDVRTDVQYRDLNMKIKLNYIDKNTLNAYISNTGKADVTFQNRTISLSTH